MPKTIKLKNNIYWDSSSITHNKKILSNILPNIIKSSLEYFELTEGNTQNCNMPDNLLFAIPLLLSNGSNYSGNQILIPGTGYSYFTCTSYRPNSQYEGIYLSLNYQGVLSFSSYRSCGTTVKGIRYFYLDI